MLLSIIILVCFRNVLSQMSPKFYPTENMGAGDCRNSNGQFYDRFFLYCTGNPEIVDNDPMSCMEPCLRTWTDEGITEILRGFVHAKATKSTSSTCFCLLDNVSNRYPLAMTTTTTFASGPIFENSDPTHPSHTCVAIELDQIAMRGKRVGPPSQTENLRVVDSEPDSFPTESNDDDIVMAIGLSLGVGIPVAIITASGFYWYRKSKYQKI